MRALARDFVSGSGSRVSRTKTVQTCTFGIGIVSFICTFNLFVPSCSLTFVYTLLMLNEERESRDEDDLLPPRVTLPGAPAALPPTILSKEGLEVLGASFC